MENNDIYKRSLYDNIGDLIGIIFATSIVIGIIDYIVCVHFLKLKRGSGGGERWFMLHAIINFWIVWTALPDLFTVLFDPIYSITQASTTSSLYPFSANVALHFYHCIIFYKDLTFDDWLHHILMIFIGTPLIFFKFRHQ